MTTNLTDEFVKKHTLMECLKEFDGAYGNTEEQKLKSLEKPFEMLAKKMIYGGFIKVREEYAIFIHTLEFYYHEEINHDGIQIKDEIVYHRNDKFKDRQVPYFPLMTLQSHWSGFDITFENPEKHYRASALIRKYAVYDIQAKKFVRLDTSGGRVNYILQDEPRYDGRSTYLQFYLNGFPIDGTNSKIKWIPFNNPYDGKVENKPRQNAHDHNWAYCSDDIKGFLIEMIKGV